jgi:hypothetical protein
MRLRGDAQSILQRTGGRAPQMWDVKPDKHVYLHHTSRRSIACMHERLHEYGQAIATGST